MKLILDLIKQHKMGRPVGIYSVCSAQPLVIEATLRHAKKSGGIALIESTSNQVNQFGGYTGMLPVDFRELVYRIAGEVDFPRENLVLGGDHLGPNCWQDLPSEEAMNRSDELIRQYVLAGFRKIHLDCSMSCSGDPVPLNDAIVAKRAARLCAVAEAAWHEAGGEPPVYIVGTEVPVPGGAQEDLHELQATSPEAAMATIEAHQQAFAQAGLDTVWPRVVGLVVQPGVEFDHHKVIDYQPTKAVSLSKMIESQPTMVYEAHSTDYQTPANLSRLVKDHFAILKVGPGVTFALREAVWALACIEEEWLDEATSSRIKHIVATVMQENPKYWNKYYHSTDRQLTIDLQYSLSDRIRYYWPFPAVEKAMEALLNNLSAKQPPLTLLSQYLPSQYLAIRNGVINYSPREILMHKIEEILGQYSSACQ